MKLTHEWQEYNMDYQKVVQDIRTTDGAEYHNCSPNAGKWNVMGKTEKDCIQIPDAEVTHVRLNKSWMSDEQEAVAEKRTTKRDRGIVLVGDEASGISQHIRNLLTDEQMKDIIVIDSSNLEQMKEQLAAGIYDKPRNIQQLTIPELTAIELPTPHYRKSHKPNTGMKLGSYKFKSNKKQIT